MSNIKKLEEIARKPIRSADDHQMEDHDSEDERLSEEEELYLEEEELYPQLEKQRYPESNRSRSPRTNKLYPDLSPFTKTTKKDKKNKKAKMPFYSNGIFSYIALGSLCLSVVLSMLCYYLRSPTPKHDPLIEIKQFLKSTFPEDCKISKNVIKCALEKVLMEDVDPEHPAVILLLASTGATRVNHELSTCLAERLDSDYLHLRGHEWNNRQKHLVGKVDRKIETSLSGSKHLGVVLIEDLHAIHYEFARILHLYCDHENAPFKRAVFIMTAHSNETIPRNADSVTIDGFATKLLNEAWQEWDNEQRSALLARITVSVAAVLPHISLSKCKS